MTEWITEDELVSSFDDVLDECYPTWTFGGSDYYPSQILPEVDPILYSLALSEHADYLASEDRVFCKGYTEPEEYPENE